MNGIARVWVIIRPPHYNQDASDSSVQNSARLTWCLLVAVNMMQSMMDSILKERIRIAIYAKDRIGNTSIPHLTTVPVKNPLKRRAIIVAGGYPSVSLARH